MFKNFYPRKEPMSRIPEKFVHLKTVRGVEISKDKDIDVEILSSPDHDGIYARSNEHRLSAEGNNEADAIERLKDIISKYGDIIGLIGSAKKDRQFLLLNLDDLKNKNE